MPETTLHTPGQRAEAKRAIRMLLAKGYKVCSYRPTLFGPECLAVLVGYAHEKDIAKQEFSGGKHEFKPSATGLDYTVYWPALIWEDSFSSMLGESLAG